MVTRYPQYTSEKVVFFNNAVKPGDLAKNSPKWTSCGRRHSPLSRIQTRSLDSRFYFRFRTATSQLCQLQTLSRFNLRTVNIYFILVPENTLSLQSRVILSAFVGHKSPFLRDLQSTYFRQMSAKSRGDTRFEVMSQKKVLLRLTELLKNSVF